MRHDPYALYGRRFDHQRLTAVLGECHLSLPEIAYRMGLQDSSSLRMWAIGQRRPRLALLLKFCEVVGCNVDAVAPRIEVATTSPVEPAPVLGGRGARRAQYFQPGRA